MNEPWTPGPWKAEGVEEVYGPSIEGPGRYPYSVIAAVTNDERAEANARLIAAAPEMAELLAWFATIDFADPRLQTKVFEVRDLLSRIREAEVTA